MRPSLLSPLVPKWGNEAFLNQALSLTQGIKAANQRRSDLSLTCHVIFVQELTWYFGHEDKPGYNESRLWQKFCASLRSWRFVQRDGKKKKAAKRREVVPLPFHRAVVCHASLRDRCPTSRPSHNPKRKASYARLFLFTFIDQLIVQVCTG